MTDSARLAGLRAEVAARPQDLALRLRLARALLEVNRPTDALEQCAAVLHRAPGNAQALEALSTATRMLVEPARTAFDWTAAEAELAAAARTPGTLCQPALTLADVAGIATVKARIEREFLRPRRSSVTQQAGPGGLLLYGPPGCGKAYLARAVAGELGATFYAVNVGEALEDSTEPAGCQLGKMLETARLHAPCVLFLNGIDALSDRRHRLRTDPGTRLSADLLLGQLDSVLAPGDGVVVVAATEYPWEVSTSLRKSGRLDVSVFVPPPDRRAREAILCGLLHGRARNGPDLSALTERTRGWAGSDLVALCTRASQLALGDSLRTGVPRSVSDRDLRVIMSVAHSSLESWYEIARNVTRSSGGEYAELIIHLEAATERWSSQSLE